MVMMQLGQRIRRPATNGVASAEKNITQRSNAGSTGTTAAGLVV